MSAVETLGEISSVGRVRDDVEEWADEGEGCLRRRKCVL